MGFKSWMHTQTEKRRRDLASLIKQTRVMIRVCKHPYAPWYAKAVAGLAVGYIFSPIQFIPTFIPVIGQLDDLCILFFGMKMLRKLTPSAVLWDCEIQIEMSALQRDILSRETSSSEEENRMAA